MKKRHVRSAKGFTLIELMIVVAIIGILAAIAIPKFAELVTRSKESAAKGSLGSVRSAISIYYSDQEGGFPVVLDTGLTTNSKYLSSIPTIALPAVSSQGTFGCTGHPNASSIVYGAITGVADNAGASTPWYYDNVTNDAGVGTLVLGCTHKDTKGNFWSSY